MSKQVYLDKIVEIEEIGEEYTIDIEVSGNRLFFANGILTHNSGYDSSELEMTDVSESFGLAHTVDLLFGLSSSEELEQLGQIMIKQLKNRYGDVNRYKKFCVGIDRSRMRLYNLDNKEQNLTGAGTTDVSSKPKDKKDFKSLDYS